MIETTQTYAKKVTVMKKNFYLDILLIICILVCGITGIVLNFHLFGGMGRAGKELFSNIHTWSGYIMLAAIVLHLAWHWKWLKAAARQLGK